MPVTHATAKPLTVPLPVRWLLPVIRDFCSAACAAPLAVVDEGPAKVTGYVDVSLTDTVTARAAFVIRSGERPATAILEIRALVWGEPVAIDDDAEAEAFVRRIRAGVIETLGERFRSDRPTPPHLVTSG